MIIKNHKLKEGIKLNLYGSHVLKDNEEIVGYFELIFTKLKKKLRLHILEFWKIILVKN